MTEWQLDFLVQNIPKPYVFAFQKKINGEKTNNKRMFMPKQFDHPSQHFLASARPGDTMTLPLHHEKPMTRWSECFRQES